MGTENRYCLLESRSGNIGLWRLRPLFPMLLSLLVCFPDGFTHVDMKCMKIARQWARNLGEKCRKPCKRLGQIVHAPTYRSTSSRPSWHSKGRLPIESQDVIVVESGQKPARGGRQTPRKGPCRFGPPIPQRTQRFGVLRTIEFWDGKRPKAARNNTKPEYRSLSSLCRTR
jgi:hypothetical protein